MWLSSIGIARHGRALDKLEIENATGAPAGPRLPWPTATGALENAWSTQEQPVRVRQQRSSVGLPRGRAQEAAEPPRRPGTSEELRQDFERPASSLPPVGG